MGEGGQAAPGPDRQALSDLLAPGDAAFRAGDPRAALARYLDAAKAARDAPPVWIKLANALEILGHFDEALAVLRALTARAPRYPMGHVALGMALMRQGDYAAGWSHYEWRRVLPPVAGFVAGLPGKPWQGEDPRGKTILIYHEQGLGDSIQFARYARLIAARGGRAVAVVGRPLARLFRGVPGLQHVAANGEVVPAFDFHASFLSLHLLLGAGPESAGCAPPYLRLPAAMATAPAAPEREGLRVGLVWAGNPDHANDRYRSMPFSALAPILAVPGASFHSLQTGPRAADLWQDGMPVPVVDLAPQLHDLTDTAAAMAWLDLVISVDTAAAHLAGALARPVWTLLPLGSDWRWLLDREDSPWYPTMRLFRQTRVGDWGGPAAEAAEALAALAAGSRGASLPPGQASPPDGGTKRGNA
jgi:hypothetical protein